MVENVNLANDYEARLLRLGHVGYTFQAPFTFGCNIQYLWKVLFYHDCNAFYTL